ncbi:MAG: YajQ family cyclic di-GMP-binding protein [Dehalococcoidia bacterium]|nr:YajQ family cyclic di-GMP-binding protein [Dehalococcoidia bacterium]
MPSFDVVSRTNMAEVDNALNNIRREISTRYDFKNSKANIERKDETITILADDDYKLRALTELLHQHLTRRSVDSAALEFKAPERASGDALRQVVTVRQGIEMELAKKIVKAMKDSKLKVQASIQGDELRITGKQRDDLQQAITLLKGVKADQPLQYVNFRD